MPQRAVARVRVGIVAGPQVALPTEATQVMRQQGMRQWSTKMLALCERK